MPEEISPFGLLLVGVSTSTISSSDELSSLSWTDGCTVLVAGGSLVGGVVPSKGVRGRVEL